MSLFPPPVPLPPPKPRAWPTVVAWLIIVACVALIMSAGRLKSGAPATAQQSDGPPAPGVEFLMQSRAAVGFHRFGGADPARTGASPAAPMLATLDDLARSSTAAQIRLIPVVAEISGKDVALARVEQLALRHTQPAPTDDLDALRRIYASDPTSLDAPQREQLVTRHGWFARLALTHGLPDGDPARVAALAPATRVATMLILIGLVGMLAIAAGLVLLIVGVTLYAGGRLRFAHVPPPPGRDGPFVEAFAVFLVGMILVSLALAAIFRARSETDVPLAANLLLALSVPPALLWLRLRGLSGEEIRAGLGWHRGRGWFREIGSGILGYVAGLPLLAVALLLTSMLIRVSGTTPSHPIVEHAVGGTTAAVTLQLYLLAVVYAPVVEEILFRGALYHHVRRWMPWWLGGVVVALVFAAIHPQGWVGIPMLATIAVMLAVLRERRGSIIAPVVAHACVNGVTVTMLVLMMR